MRKEVSKRKRNNKMLRKTLKHFSKLSLILSRNMRLKEQVINYQTESGF